MKIKRLLILLLALITSGCLALFVSCEDSSDASENGSESFIASESGTDDESEETEVSITLSETATVAEFESVTLVPVVKGEGEITWTSSDKSVITVDGGVVYGVKAGTATVKASIGNKEAVCTVTVTPTHYAHEIALSQEEFVMSKGRSGAVKVSVTFNGNPLDVDGLEYVWTPVGNASEIATIETSDNGASATFTGVDVGEAEYDVSTIVRGYEAAERVTIKVIDNVVILDLTNEKIQSGEGLYSLGLTLGSESTSRLEIGTVNILEDGAMKGVADVSWTVDNDEIITVENGAVVARKAGYSLMTGSAVYGEKTLNAYVGVTVSKGKATLENVKLVIEAAADKTIKIPDEIAGTVEKITVCGKTVFDGSTALENRNATVIENSMPCEMRDLGEDKAVVIETEEMVYDLKADVYTLIIDNKEDLDAWQKIACDEAVRAGLCGADKYGQFMTGYFLLGSDVAYNDNYTTFKTFMDFGNLYNWGKEWGDGSSFGFKGIFDGRGHVIDGLNVSGRYNGFVTTLADGTIENIAFTNAGVSDGASFIARAGFGTIRNIYVSYAKISGGTSDNVSTAFGSYDFTNRTVENLIIDVSYCDFGDEINNVFVIGGGYGKMNALVIGAFAENADKKALLTDVAVAAGNVAGHVNDYAELFADEELIGAFAEIDGTFWANTGKIILPTSVMLVHGNDEVRITNSETEINKNGEIRLKTNGRYYEFVLKEAVQGITLSGDVLAADATAVIGSSVTVTVTSLVSGKSFEYVVTVAKLKEKIELAARRNIDLALSVEGEELRINGSLTVDLSEGDEYIGNNEIVVKYGDVVLYEGKGASSVNLLATDSLKGVFGNKMLTVIVYGDEKDYELILPVTVISKSISSKSELDGWQEIASHVAVAAGLNVKDAYRQYMTGYFTLENDIAYNGTFTPYTPFSTYWSFGNNGVNGVKYGSGEWTDGTSYGFKGVFDGCGHAIEGMKVSGDLNGFIVTLANGTIKNVSFTDAAISNSSSLVVKAGIGSIENVFVQYSSITETSGAGTFFSTGNDSARKVKNCIIDVTECTFESASNITLIGSDAEHDEEIVIYDGVYVVGTIPSTVTLKDKNANCCAIGAFASYAALLTDEAASAKIAGFDNSFWKVTNKIVIPIGVYAANNVDPEITNEETEIIMGISLRLTANAKFIVYAINAVDGVTLNENILLADETATEGAEITVIATSLVSGKSAQFVFTIASMASKYEEGTVIDADSLAIGDLVNFGLGSIWSKGITLAPENLAGYTGSVAQFYNYNGTIYGDMNAHGASIKLNDAVNVKDGLNFIRIRTYIAHDSLDKVDLRFYRSDRTNHEVESGVWFDDAKTIETNKWVNIYLAVSKFAVNGKVDGFKFAVFTAETDTAKLYIDDVTLQTNDYTSDDDMDLTQVTFPQMDSFGATIWNRGVIDASAAPVGASGKVLVMQNNEGSDILYHFYGVMLNNPVTIKDGMNYVKLRMYVSSPLASAEIRFYRSDRTNQQVEPGVWFDDVKTIETNKWVDVYLEVSKFAVDGKFAGYKSMCATEGTVGGKIYVDSISLTDVNGTKIVLAGSTISYPGFGNAWNNGATMTDNVVDLPGGTSYACAKITFASPVDVTGKTAILITMRANVAPCRIAMFKHSRTAPDALDYYYDNCPANESVTMTVNISEFVEDGTLKGFMIALWGDAADVNVVIERVVVV